MIGSVRQVVDVRCRSPRARVPAAMASIEPVALF